MNIPEADFNRIVARYDKLYAQNSDLIQRMKSLIDFYRSEMKAANKRAATAERVAIMLMSVVKGKR